MVADAHGPLRVFVHGSGRSGTAAWPAQDHAAGVFVAFDKDTPIEERVATLQAEHAGRPVVVFAHSIGAVPVALAAHGGILDIRALVLVEPALYDIARGESAIERHIAIHAEARAQAEQGDLRSFWAIVRPVMFGGPFAEEKWGAEESFAAQWARAELPWGHGIRRDALRGIPTLVVTGEWNEEYETIARRLVEEGAEHRVLSGAGHRAQDLPAFEAIATAFLASVGSGSGPRLVRTRGG
ncbi:alpha/beta fold hydrolase [Microbacterium horticulturae]|uniref:Alpha/beta fold hydrolase n=1 Tax=Microbacterium horticulturae TaxID=3028316 RepID=A0ABY8BU82_9MICO|nr:alpha/beta fold hydrolase [Microbacterium sp. KACC 23027]WEG07377.1 alpha/beta fold hydrolase [Microbacterium sp. KACC 23027]